MIENETQPATGDGAAPAERFVRIVELGTPGHCSSCGNEVTWSTTLNGKPMPLEAGSRVRVLFARDRQVEHVERYARKPGAVGEQHVKTAERAAKLRAQGYLVREEVYVCWEIPASLTHWANCPSRDVHRRPAKGARP